MKETERTLLSVDKADGKSNRSVQSNRALCFELMQIRQKFSKGTAGGLDFTEIELFGASQGVKALPQAMRRLLRNGKKRNG
jgi:hypothetical protein